ncbi:DnaJ domain protein [Blumeria hordei DH14]|uniref:Diphthamide biosynthesis protein 4 n=1 Tax=Blumeria graminis f. sp. hordei (strain DH14) TaxID=546991 RepID=N1JEG6_BLUG1|nr:DnaJ domain protein [Blumeria hordei DH14]
MTDSPTFYKILDLPEDFHTHSAIPLKILRAAYHKALLRNHPDKASSATEIEPMKAYTVDQITQAFSTLSDPKLAAAYSKELESKAVSNYGNTWAKNYHPITETVDLEEICFDDSENIWFKGCRCGDDRGYIVQEKDLEVATEDGEISIECKGCSLWLTVLFGVLEEESSASVQTDNTDCGILDNPPEAIYRVSSESSHH